MRPEKSLNKPFESGRASLEFLVLSITLFVPILYLGLSLASLQGASLATEAAARNAVRVFVQGASSPNPERRVEVAALLALSNHGFDRAEILETQCSATPCGSPGGRILVRVGVKAPLFSTSFIPGPWGEGTRLVVSEASGLVSAYGGVG
jgi:hypothetical protein